MAVYVDDAAIRAEVRNGSRVRFSRWSHLTADTQQELHEFAARLGLRREWFQRGQPTGGNPSPFWHYDVTSGKRAQALTMSAIGVSSRELARYCRARADQPMQPGSESGAGRDQRASTPRRRAAPQNPCPDCGPAELTHGRQACQACQACGLLPILATRAAPPPGGPTSPQIEAGS